MKGLRLVGWALAAVAVSGWLALVEMFWLPLRIGGVLVPLSVVVAAVGNLLIVGAARRLSGSGLVGVLPAVTWLVVVVSGMIRRPEGDLIIIGGGASGVVNLAFLLVGVVAAAFAAGRALSGPRRASVRPVDGGPARGPAGSGIGGAR